MADFVQGFLASIVIDGNDTTPITVDFTLTRGKTSLDKSVMDSSGEPKSIPGMATGNLAFTGHISQAELNTLEVSYAKSVAVPFVITIEQGLGTDASYAGAFTWDSFDVDTSAEDNWGFSASGPLDGAVTFTPSVA